MITPATYNFTAYQNGTLDKTFTVTLTSGPKDFTNYSGHCQLRKLVQGSKERQPVALDLTTLGNGVTFPNPLTGKFKLYATNLQMQALEPARYEYDVLLTNSLGVTDVYIKGAITVERGVTENT